ncbi:MAG: FMN-binding negative transcriptional regulator [Curvibacter sp.]|nr:FMN-binding negative transcriptional regulator [Curvibacter sp.]
MYLPPQFKASDPALAHALMREHPFASLVSIDEDGLPFITHLPLHLSADGQVLTGHCARPNPHWRHLQARPRARVAFLGPQAYMSPAVYPDLARVPTWNYLAVHATVQARLLEGDEAKDAVLKQLIGDHEPAYAAQWRAQDPDWAAKMLQGIVAFELAIEQLDCKLKLNQHRPEAHAAMYQAYRGAASEGARGLAAWMERLGLVQGD